MNEFTQYILDQNPAVPPLPLMHTMEGLGFRSAFTESRLEPNSCPVFKEEKLLYLFYGRPAYRINSSDYVNSDVCFPICFILHPNTVEKAKRVYPFDSGAYINKLFSTFLFEKYEIDHFLVNPTTLKTISCPEIPARIVATFYENNSKYYWGDCNQLLRFSALDYEAKDYHELIRNRGGARFDDRRGTIEVQIEESILLSQDTVCAVALPQLFMEDEKIRGKVIKEWKAKPLVYRAYLSDPSQFTAVIIEKVGDFLTNEGFFEE